MSRMRVVSSEESTNIADLDFAEVCYAELDKMLKGGAITMTFIAGQSAGKKSVIKSIPNSPDLMFGAIMNAARQYDEDLFE